MGGSTRLKFPFPHRKSKKLPSVEVQTISAPMTTKAQKFLGSGEISIDTSSPTSPTVRSKVWDSRSVVSGVSGISVTISDTTTAASVPGIAGAGSTVTAGTKTRGKTAWDQESDIIPKGLSLNPSSTARSQNPDVTTDASSLRRRGSNSTIVSYYDKAKLPLSISQQTSSSAMAKGLPGDKSGPLAMECPRPAPAPPTMQKKKPSRLDMSSILSGSTSSKLSRFSQRRKDSVSDLFTRSPSVMSTSPIIPPAGPEAKPAKLRKKHTKENLRSNSVPRWGSFSAESSGAIESPALRKRATDTGNLNQLYKHYEETSFRDTIDDDELDVALPDPPPSDAASHADSATTSPTNARQSTTIPSPPTTRLKHSISPSFGSVSYRPFPAYSPDEGCGPIAENPRVSATSSSLASPAGDYSASISSRHTRTSRASRMTESFADFDPNTTSILSLSSDSEDDYSEPPKTATSLGSRDSTHNPSDLHRRQSNTSSVYTSSIYTSSVTGDLARTQSKSRYRSSGSPQAPFLAIPEDAGATGGSSPVINPRTSSGSSATTTNSPRPSVSTVASSVRSQTRLSQASMSTTESVPTHFSQPRPYATGSSPKQAPEVRHIAMQSRSMTAITHQHARVPEQQRTPLIRLSASPKKGLPMLPVRPSNSDPITQGQHDSANERNGPVLTLSGTDAASEERFIAVTPQEEMLLSAMRAKRAMMREKVQNGSAEAGAKAGARDKTASKKESLSSIETVKMSSLQPVPQSHSSHARNSSRKLATALQFPEPPASKLVPAQEAIRPLKVPGKKERILHGQGRTASSTGQNHNAELSPAMSDFIIDFDAEQFPKPPKAVACHSRNSSKASVADQPTHQRQYSFGRPRPDSEFLPNFRFAEREVEPMPRPHKGLDLDAVTNKTSDCPPRSSSPATSTEKENSPPPSRKKAVRISAVGLSLPELGQWGDDG
ncbi:unnamed protein product [Discula destructiva]